MRGLDAEGSALPLRPQGLHGLPRLSQLPQISRLPGPVSRGSCLRGLPVGRRPGCPQGMLGAESGPATRPSRPSRASISQPSCPLCPPCPPSDPTKWRVLQLCYYLCCCSAYLCPLCPPSDHLCPAVHIYSCMGLCLSQCCCPIGHRIDGPIRRRPTPHGCSTGLSGMVPLSRQWRT